MSNDGANRNIYFDKHVRTQTTSQGYLEALQKSPYRMHKRMAYQLQKTWDEDKKNFDIECARLMGEGDEIGDTEKDSTGGD